MKTLIGRLTRNSSIRSMACDDRGLSTVEYVVILVLIAVAAIGTWKAFGKTIMDKVNAQGDAIQQMK